MAISTFDLFTIGIGPSSSHAVGPMRSAKQFVDKLAQSGLLSLVSRVRAEMYGSLGATGKGHGTPKAVLLGLEGGDPETIEIASITERMERIQRESTLYLLGSHAVSYSEKQDLILHRQESLPYHPNGMVFTAFDNQGQVILSKTFYSIGGGFVIDEKAASADCIVEDTRQISYPFNSGAELLALCTTHQCSIAELMRANEKAWRTDAQTQSGLLQLWQVMQACVEQGLQQDGILPGGLNLKRRAAGLYQHLLSQPEASLADPLTVMDWVTLYALAVNEENAAGGRVVTAPTNGAAGIIPAVLHYYWRFVAGANEEGVQRFLLTAAAIGILYKKNASISGAEVGCQGEVGSACSMAAGALTEVMGGSPAQVENAAEIAMEHNLGLTCDPVGGLVQVPCIERNAMASIKAIHASRMALQGDGSHFISLDKVIKTMRETGRDMQEKYKETSRGGLALTVVEVPVNIIEC